MDDRAPLERYRKIRDFTVTPEPAPAPKQRRRASRSLRFVIQKHWASRLHYDFRLELDGVLMSWAVPKGPSFDPTRKRMAVHVEDHPVSYADFEGTIPPKQYGAGSVIVWDRGTWQPVGDPKAGMRAGKLVFTLHGEKLAGLWELVRISKPGDAADQWMLFKKRDQWARPHDEFDVVTALPDSVVARPLGLAEGRAESAKPSRAERGGAPDLSAATPCAMPDRLTPQLATQTATLPAGDDWVIETKFDGYRLMAKVEDAKVSLITRGGHDWTHKFKTLAKEIEKLDVSEGWIDGEAVVLKDGLPDFGGLQDAVAGAADDAVVYFAFDLPFWEGKDLRRVPLVERRAHLRALIQGHSDRVRFSEAFEAPASEVFQAACKLGLEGLILKRADSPYSSARNQSWLKAKCKLRQEFIVGGYALREGAKGEIGKLVLGVNEEGGLRHVGAVGTGWNSKTAGALHDQLRKLVVDRSPFSTETKRSGRWGPAKSGDTVWVKPSVVVEVEFTEWTEEGLVRQASFKGLRLDKPAREIRREAVRTAVSPHGGTSTRITHPERIVDPSTGITKADLVHYYESVARLLLPHLQDRPVSLVRAPDGIAGQMFFQKHAERGLPALTEHPAEKWPGHAPVLSVDSVEAVVAAAQMNVIEFHTWNSTVSRILFPDRVIFDLDPGEGVGWEQLQEAALLVQVLLGELGLTAWLKTSGGKGLHVVVPLAPKRTYEVVKRFSQSLVRHLAATIPQRFVAVSGATNRKGRIFVDYLRNGVAQTTATAFSARARPGMGVSMPVSWDQLMTLKSGAQWSVRDAREYLSFQTADPWSDYWSSRQSLTEPIKRLAGSSRT